MCFFWVVCLLVFFQKSSSFCRENEIFENKKKNLDQFLTYKKENLGPTFNFTTYIYAVKLKSGPRFGGVKVKKWSKF